MFADPPFSALAAAADERRLRGSHLLVGEPGIGRRRLALELSRRLLCPGETPESSCAVCRRVLAGTHPDVLIFDAPEVSKQADAIREVVRATAERPFEAPRRVVIIDGTEALNQTASNILLKPLEEPPGYLVFLLLGRSLDDVLPTIRSRCSVHPIPTPSEDAVASHLRALGRSPAEVDRALALCGGRIAWAVAGRDEELEALRDDLLAAIEGIPAGPPSGISELSRRLADADDPALATELAAGILRDLAVSELGGAAGLLRNRDRSERIAPLAAAFPPGLALRAAREIQNARDRLAVNPNKRMMFEDLLLSAVRP